MTGKQRGEISIRSLVDELRVTYVPDADFDRVINLAQLEWVSELNLVYVMFQTQCHTSMQLET